MCLEGSNLDFEYSFTPIKQLGKFHAQGELKLVSTRVIKRGDSAEIDFQDKFIHQNHHHSDLTVNLCFRTPEQTGSNIANFLYSGLRFEKDPHLLYQVEKLKRFTALGEFDFETLPFSLDEALYCLIDNYQSPIMNSTWLKLKAFLEIRVKQETGLDVSALMDQHEKTLDQLQDEYD